MRRRPIGICGFAETGKDTTADYVSSRYGYTSDAFATRVRRILEAMNPIVGQEHNRDRDYPGYNYIYYNDAVRDLGYTEAKRKYPIRPLLVALGNAAKQQLGSTVWIDPVLPRDYFSRSDVQPTIVVDVRYPDEYERLKELNGFLIAIHRPGVTAANEHEALHVPKIQTQTVIHVHNDGTIEDLHRKLDEVMRSINALYA